MRTCLDWWILLGFLGFRDSGRGDGEIVWGVGGRWE